MLNKAYKLLFAVAGAVALQGFASSSEHIATHAPLQCLHSRGLDPNPAPQWQDYSIATIVGPVESSTNFDHE
jgi:hypothetical protein